MLGLRFTERPPVTRRVAGPIRPRVAAAGFGPTRSGWVLLAAGPRIWWSRVLRFAWRTSTGALPSQRPSIVGAHFEYPLSRARNTGKRNLSAVPAPPPAQSPGAESAVPGPKRCSRAQGLVRT